MSFYKKPLFGVAFGRIARGALRCVPLFVLVFAFAADGYGQSSGTIRGKVKNMATGKYLTNALVEVEGTNRSTYTDQYGEYRLTNVPEGEVTVKASYVGLGEKSISVTVGSGVNTAADISLFQARAGLEDESVFELEAFTVDGSDFDSNAIAQQERKTSSNLKLVQHADSLGDIAEGNIGEFLKNMPGVAIDYVAADARQIKLRGMAAEFTTVTVDGASMASANSSGNSRGFELEQVSLSNVEQLEIYKLPRPDNSASAMGGSVNLVSKNAFAQGGRKINYKAYLTYNSVTDLTLNDTPGWTPDRSRSKINPSFELSYSDVFLNDRLGASFSFSQSNKFNVQQRFSPNGNYYVGSDGSVANNRLQIQDGPKFTFRQSVAGNFDFKASENTILTLRMQRNWYEAEFANRNRNWIIKHNDNTTDDSKDVFPVVGTDGQISGVFDGGSNIGGSHRNKAGETDHIDIGAKHTFGDWKIDYGYTYSKATNRYRDFTKGYAEGIVVDKFSNGTTDRLELDFTDISESGASIIAKNGSGTNLNDLGFDLSKGRLNRLQSRPFDSTDTRKDIRLNVSRDFEIGENKTTIKFGYNRDTWDRFRINRELRYTANSSAPVKSMPASEFRDEVYYDMDPGFGVGGLDWPSQRQIYEYYLANQDEFDYSLSTDVSRQYGTRLDLEEIVTAYYLMGSLSFAGDKGMVTTGVRYESTDVSGFVPFNGTGNYTLDENGDLEGEFFEENRSYGTYHPSVHLRYNVTNKIVARLSYANTLGRPNFPDMFGPATITDPAITPDEDDTGFSINVKNPGLKPRRSNNVDLTMEYYAGETSMVSASVFQNEIKNFIGTDSRPITEADAAYYGLSKSGGFQPSDSIETKINAGDATVRGVELNWNQGLNLEFVPEFFKASSVYANATFLDLEGNFDNADSFSDSEGKTLEVWKDNLPGFAKETISYGILFKKNPFSLNFRWNVRGEEIANSTTQLYDDSATPVKSATKIYRWDQRRVTLDVSGEYKLNDRMSLYFAAKNATNAPYRLVFKTEGDFGATQDEILNREEQFGADWSLGIKGTF